MSSPRHDLAYLLSPLQPEEFFSGYWENEPLITRREEPLYYSSLISPDDLDFIVSSACQSKTESVELLGEGEFGAAPTDAAAAAQRYRDGASIRIIGAQSYWKPLSLLCSRLEQELCFPVRSNLYLTPPDSRALNRHHDPHDVFVLQLSGQKRWHIFEPVTRLPSPPVSPLSHEAGRRGRAGLRAGGKEELGDFSGHDRLTQLLEITLEPGDLLYLPRGFIHEAQTHDAASAHLTVGIHVLTWHDLLAAALERTSRNDERFRKALPPGFALGTEPTGEVEQQFAALLETFARTADGAGAFEEVAFLFVQSRRATGSWAPTPPHELEELNADSVMERRPGLVCRLATAHDQIGIVSSFQELWMPAAFTATLRFVVLRTQFRVRELPGRMSDVSKVSLVRRLTQEGFLRIARAADADKL